MESRTQTTTGGGIAFRPARIELNKRSWKSRQPGPQETFVFRGDSFSRPRRGSSTILTRDRLINLVGENFSLAGTNCGLTNRGHADPRLFPSRILQDEEDRSNLNSPRVSPSTFLRDFFLSLCPRFRIGRIMYNGVHSGCVEREILLNPVRVFNPFAIVRM